MFKKPNPSHFWRDRYLDEVNKIKAKIALVLGVSVGWLNDNMPEHYKSHLWQMYDHVCAGLVRKENESLIVLSLEQFEMERLAAVDISDVIKALEGCKKEYGIACNYDGDSVVRKGSKCFITFSNPGNGSDRVQVWVRSRSGRAVVKFVDIRKLSNFRSKWIPKHVRECNRAGKNGNEFCYSHDDATKRASAFEFRFGKKG